MPSNTSCAVHGCCGGALTRITEQEQLPYLLPDYLPGDPESLEFFECDTCKTKHVSWPGQDKPEPFLTCPMCGTMLKMSFPAAMGYLERNPQMGHYSVPCKGCSGLVHVSRSDNQGFDVAVGASGRSFTPFDAHDPC